MRIALFILFVFFNAQLLAQCGDTDISIWNNTWESCQESENPNPARESGHWIQYEFDAVYKLTHTQIWNTNEVGKSVNGFRNVVVDYSEDGETWIELGNFEFSQGTEEAIYGGFMGFDFEKKSAKYVLITALSNWGGDCFGLAEVKFNVWSELAPCENPPCGEEACGTPSGIQVTNISDTQVFLEWENATGAEAYLVIVINGEDEEEFEVEGTEITLTDLEENTFYEIEIITLCEEDESEDAFISFTTGTTSISLITPKNLSAVSLIPNPSNSDVHLVFDSKLMGDGVIHLNTLLGTTLNSYPIQFAEGRNSFLVETKDIPAGVYHITLNVPEENFSLTKKLVLLRK